MKFSKKLVATLLAGVMVFALAACTGGKPKEEGKTDATTLKIGVIHIGNPADGAGYSYAHDKGIVKAQAANGLKDEQIIRKNMIDDTDAAACETAITECIEAGATVILGTSWGYMDTMEKLAALNPKVKFLHCSGYKGNETNFSNYFGRIYEARYLAGIAAGMKTITNKIGYVAAQDVKNPEVTGGIDAFALGVKSVKPEAKIFVKVTSTWFDLDKEKAAAVALLDEGCDVIAQHQDTAQPQIAAQEKNCFGIGYNSDMHKEAPKAVLTSVIWNWDVFYTKAIKSIIDGTWTSAKYFGTMKEGLVDVTDLSENCAPGTSEKIQAAKKKIVEEDYRVFSGELKDNAGNVVCKAGEFLDDAYIAGEINWYLDNVSVK